MTKSLDEWTSSIVARCQRFAGEIAGTEPDAVRERVEALASSLTAPPTRTHNLILAPLLLETAFRVSDQLHRGLSSVCGCRQIGASTVRSFLDWREPNPAQGVARRGDEFFPPYGRHHPAAPARRPARALGSGGLVGDRGLIADFLSLQTLDCVPN